MFTSKNDCWRLGWSGWEGFPDLACRFAGDCDLRAFGGEMKMSCEFFHPDFDWAVDGARLLHITLEGGTRGLDCPVRLCVEETGKER